MKKYSLKDIIETYRDSEQLTTDERKVVAKYIQELTGISSEYMNLILKGYQSIISRIKEMMEKDAYTYVKNDDGGFTRYIFVDYNEQYLSDSTISDIFCDENPRNAFYDYLSEKAIENMEYEEDLVNEEIRSYLSEDELLVYEANIDKIWDEIRNILTIAYNPDDFKADVLIDIGIDTGDANYEYTLNNITNYCGSGCISEHSSILWLCKRQGKEAAFRTNIENGYKDDSFISSVRDELDNLTSSIGCLTFLVKTDLETAFNLYDKYYKEYKLNNFYDIEKRKGTETITIGKDTNCGLFDLFNGGGSLFEIKLDKDVVVPIKYIGEMNVDQNFGRYSVRYVYGIDSSFWKESLKIS